MVRLRCRQGWVTQGWKYGESQAFEGGRVFYGETPQVWVWVCVYVGGRVGGCVVSGPGPKYMLITVHAASAQTCKHITDPCILAFDRQPPALQATYTHNHIHLTETCADTHRFTHTRIKHTILPTTQNDFFYMPCIYVLLPHTQTGELLRTAAVHTKS